MEPSETHKGLGLTIRYASSADDAIAIHQFLLVVGSPMMRVPVDGTSSLLEVIRVVNEEVAVMAIVDGRLVGSIGLISQDWWYNPNESFLTERWHFVLPRFQNTIVNAELLSEAQRLADESGVEFIHHGKVRERKGSQPRLLMMPRVSTRRV